MPVRLSGICFALLTSLVVGLLMVPALAQTPSIPAAGFQGIWYEITGGSGDYPNKYGGGLGTYPQQIAPISIFSAAANKTFFTISLDIDQGAGRNIGHALSYFDHTTGMVARPQIWIDKGTGDAHDAPTLAIDNDGYLYMFSMTHGENRRSYISKSTNPYDISSFSNDLVTGSSASDMAVFGNPSNNPGQSGDPRFSYASPWYVPNAEEEEKFLLLHTRYISGQRDLFTTSSANADDWTTRKTFSQIESGQYQTSWIKPDGETVGTIFNVHPTGQGLDWRTDLYYMQTSDQAQTWQTVDGLTLIDNSGTNNDPFTSRPDGAGSGSALVYDAALNERVYLKDINYDAAGNPVILFLTSPSSVPGDHGAPGPDRFVKTAYWTGSNWSIHDVTTTDHNYDHGSLYVEPDGTWRVIAPFIDGPQLYGTGGEIGMWTSDNQGQSWMLDKQLTTGSYHNHTYARRPLNAQDDFYAVWADGDAFENSDVGFLFANKQGDVFQLPYDMTTDFAAPIPFVPVEPPLSYTISGQLLNASVDGTIQSISVSYGTTSKSYTPSQLISARLTAFGGQIVVSPPGTIADIIMPSSALTAPAPSERAGLLGDDLADTGFVNLTSWGVDFGKDIFNRPGPDIILVDWGGSDTVDITINGITHDDAGPTTTSFFESQTGLKRFQSIQTDVDTLLELLSATFSQGPNTSASSTAYAIDLSDFGFAEGEFFLSGNVINFTDGQGIDPMAIFGLPMPGDFDLDNDVDGNDFLEWQRGSGSSYTDLDLADWKQFYGAGSPGLGVASQHTIPEPATSVLTFAVALCCATHFTRITP